MSQEKLSPIEIIKEKSDGLRGTLKESLADNYTGTIRPDDEALIKFHGMYAQDDRDRREERATKKLERLFSFMIRLRIPGGLISSSQWKAIHDISEEHGTGVLKITTRQTIQLHGLLKNELRTTIQEFLISKLDSIAACGDVNRNVICSAHPQVSPLFKEIHAYADKISTLLLPKTQAYYEIWIDGDKVYERSAEEDPLYKKTYLPRKFKVAIAIPPTNDIDVFANDLGLIAIVRDGVLKGFNLSIGGGMGATHGNADTYPRLGTIIGFLDTEEKIMKAAYEIVTIQRDFGNRSDRKLSRLKYTLDRMGVDNFIKELEKRTGFPLLPAEEFKFTERTDRFGWLENDKNEWFYTLFVEHGVIKPYQKSFLHEVALLNICDYRFTCNQNLILGSISKENKTRIEQLIQKYKVEEQDSNLRKNSMACVALPTCSLALAESQRYLPHLVTKIESILKKHSIKNDAISIRMTGCPNGCARPYLAEIGLVGTALGQYNLRLGGDRLGERLNFPYKEHLNESEILLELDTLLGQYVEENKEGDTFGDYIYKKFYTS